MAQARKTGWTFNVREFDWFLNDAGQHYGKKETHAPAVEVWLDLTADRLREGTLTVGELTSLGQLWNEETGWEHNLHAQNRAYKLLESLGKLPVGANSW